MTIILCLACFLSGASALIFELLWFQLAGLAFGNSVWAASIVLSSFMGGLALGNGIVAYRGHRIRTPVRVYAIIEVVIGVSGLALVVAYPAVTGALAPLLRAALHRPAILNTLRAVVAFLLMLAPATAMGATLPVLVRALYAERPNFGRVLGALYGWNTLGAVTGVVMGDRLFVKWFGIRGAGVVAAGLNLCAAALALWLMGRMAKPGGPRTESGGGRRWSLGAMRCLAASFMSGLTLLALEVVWFRFGILFFDSDSWHFAVMLATVLSGIGLGGLLAARRFRRDPDAHGHLVPLLFLNGGLVALLYRGSGLLLSLSEQHRPDIHIVCFALYLMFPVCLVSGAVFTMLGKALHAKTQDATRAAGLVSLANTTGAMVGSLLAGLVLIPLIGIEECFFALGLTYGVIGFLMLERKRITQSTVRCSCHVLALLAFVTSLSCFPFGLMNGRLLAIPCAKFLKAGEKRVAVREGLTETSQYLRTDLLGEPYQYRLMTNNHSMAGSSSHYAKAFVYLPVALHPEPRTALVIGVGSGETLKALTDTACLRRLDVVDTSRDIVDLLDIRFDGPRANPVNDRRVRVHIEDGRFFLLTRQTKFDLITGEPPPPTLNGIVSLYTQEFFQLIHDRLADGGIVTYWLPVGQLETSAAKAIVKGFCNVFSNASIWSAIGLDWMMVGVKEPARRVSAAEFSRQWKDPVVGPEMQIWGLTSPEQFGSLFIADGERLREWLSDALPLTDDRPRRMSQSRPDRGRHKPGYVALMDPLLSRSSFLASAGIGRMWPEPFRQAAAKHFPARPVINEILTSPQRSIAALHRCLHDPLLADYVLWAMGSEHASQRIVSKALKQKPLESFAKDDQLTILLCLAAGAAQDRDYLAAQEHLRLAAHTAEGGPLHRAYVFLRVYFLFIAGEKVRAMEAGREYINQTNIGVEMRSDEVATYWNWLTQSTQ